MELDALVEDTLADLGVGRQNAALCLDLLSQNGNSVNTDRSQMLGDKLRLFLYIMGEVPISLKSGAKKRITYISDLKLLSYRTFDFHSEGHAEVKDDRFYRLLARIAKRQSRKKGPSLESLVDELGSSPLVEVHFGRTISYDDVLSEYFLLVQYMTGKRKISIFKNGRQRKMRIQSTDDLLVLSKAAIESGTDRGLQRLLKRVLSEEGNRGGQSWQGLVDKAGRSSSVVSYLGREVTYGDVGKPTPEHDKQVLLMYLTGKIPIITKEGVLVLRGMEDLHVFMVYENARISHPDAELARLFNRAKSRKSRGGDQGFTEMFNDVGRSRQVREKYGRAITYRDVVLESLLHSCASELEEIMLGKREVAVDGFTTRVSALRDLPFLRPDWAFADPQVKRLRNRIKKHTPETGMGFYDIVDRVGQWPAVAGQFGRDVTRFDVNPKILQYLPRRFYIAQQGQTPLTA